jgi:Sporulation and spore germination
VTARVRRLLAVALAGLALAGCGITPERSAREITKPPAPYQVLPSDTPAVAETGSVVERLFLVRDNMLVQVDRAVRAQPTLDGLANDLIAGPTSTERAQGMTTSLLATDLLGPVRVDSGLAVVQLAVGLTGTGRNDEVLALGQLVCTLAAHAGVTGVVFVRNGQRISVPRADASLSLGPFSRADYESLIAPG